jgi:hypothetical protein
VIIAGSFERYAEMITRVSSDRRPLAFIGRYGCSRCAVAVPGVVGSVSGIGAGLPRRGNGAASGHRLGSYSASDTHQNSALGNWWPARKVLIAPPVVSCVLPGERPAVSAAVSASGSARGLMAPIRLTECGRADQRCRIRAPPGN